MSEELAALDAAETVAWIYGDTETVRRLQQLAEEVREAHGELVQPRQVCPIMPSVPALPGLELSVVAPGEIPLAAAVAARGMADNPISLALFGQDRRRRLRGLEPVFTLVLASLPGPIVCARRQGHIVGIAALAPPGQCLFRQAMERSLTLRVAGKRVQISAMPSVPRYLLLPLLRLGPRGLARVSAMSEAYLQHDPPQPHQHVELVAVEAALQGLGVGRLMMEELCRQMDREPAPGWLETDKEENVRFYRHYGFEVAAEETVLGVPNWYMRRG